MADLTQTGAEVQAILDSVADKADASAIPTKVSQLKNDSGYLVDSNQIKYSTTPRIVGKWIDNSNIWRVTLSYQNYTLPTNKWFYFRDEIVALGIKQYVNVQGVVQCYSEVHATSPVWQPVPRVCPDANEYYNIGFGDFDSTKLGILFGTKFTKINQLYVTIDYIKN